MSHLASMVLLIAWISGIIFAKGFFSTTFAIFVPFYALYLVIEKAILNIGLL